MSWLGKLLIALGLAAVLAGAALLLMDKPGPVGDFLRKIPLGRLPGDNTIRRPGFFFSFPVVTCLVISAVLTLLFSLFRR